MHGSPVGCSEMEVRVVLVWKVIYDGGECACVCVCGHILIVWYGIVGDIMCLAGILCGCCGWRKASNAPYPDMAAVIRGCGLNDSLEIHRRVAATLYSVRMRSAESGTH